MTVHMADDMLALVSRLLSLLVEAKAHRDVQAFQVRRVGLFDTILIIQCRS
jgi:hypothetical protein